MKLHSLAGALLAVAASAQLAQAGAPANAQVAVLSPSEKVDFEVFLPLRDKPGLASLLAAQQTAGSPSYHRWLTPAQFAARFGPTQASVARVSAVLAADGLEVTATHSRSLHVAGTAAAVGKAFGARLDAVTAPGGARRIVAESPLRPQAALAGENVVVVAFAGLPERRPHFHRVDLVGPDNRNGVAGPYEYDDLKQAYDYPSYQTMLPGGKRLDGTGVNVAVLMETDVLDSDIAAMFNHENFTATTGVAPPTVTHLAVDGGSPFDPTSGGSFEASLDVQQVLGGAPGASVSLVSLPDLSDEHILDGYVAIVDANTFDIVSSSFGGCELIYTAAYNGGADFTVLLDIFDEVFQEGNADGVTFIASSGDSGGLGCPNLPYFNGKSTGRFVVGVETPADDPAVTAVGGGNLLTTAPSASALTSNYVSENTAGDPEILYDPYGLGDTASGGYWGAGGGRSVVFAQPSYQNSVSLGGGRIVPDVGLQVGGCPSGIAVTPCGPNRSAAIVTVAGTRYGVIGTSVAAPEFAGALALAVETAGGRLGNLNGFLWTRGAVQNTLGGAHAVPQAQFYHKNVPGFDGHWTHAATNGFDYMTGNGVADVRQLFDMQGFARAGDPQTASNP